MSFGWSKVVFFKANSLILLQFRTSPGVQDYFGMGSGLTHLIFE